MTNSTIFNILLRWWSSSHNSVFLNIPRTDLIILAIIVAFFPRLPRLVLGRTVLRVAPWCLVPTETKAVSDLEEDVDVAVDTSKVHLAGASGEDRDINEGVDALWSANRKSAVDDKALGRVFRVRDVVVSFIIESDGWLSWTLLVDLVVRFVVGESGGAPV